MTTAKLEAKESKKEREKKDCQYKVAGGTSRSLTGEPLPGPKSLQTSLIRPGQGRKSSDYARNKGDKRVLCFIDRSRRVSKRPER